MPALPQDPIDRLATLEAQVATLRSSVADNRRRAAEHTARRDPWPAVTAEWSEVTSTTSSTTTTSGSGGSTPAEYDPWLRYPKFGDADADLLPVKFLSEAVEADSDEVSFTVRSPEPRVRAVSPVGWLPPDARVEVAFDGHRYQICESPQTLHGIACCEIPHAVKSGDAWLLTSRSVCLFRETAAGVYEPQRWVDGTPVQMEFHNAHPELDAPAQTLLTARQNADRVWVVDGFEAAGSTTSSTTTTTGIGETASCAGQCKWVWSAANNSWSLDSETCSATTTTTGGQSSTTSSTTTTSGGESSTTSSTTTTTAFWCGSSTTTSSTSTTTGDGGCGCLYPTYCGEADGECTYTGCSESRNYRPACETTTSSTTSTTCDCNTTTTSDGCTNGCDWIGVPTSSGWVWRRVSNGCSSICPCPAPEGDPYCAAAHTDCVLQPQPPPPPPPPGCSGGCTYWWLPELGQWVRTASTCADVPDCQCVPPSVPGNVCAPIGVPCAAPTTTSDAGPTPDAPCADCYRSTTSSTTTTTGACAGGCKWSWSTGDQAWSAVWDLCDPGCPCVEPPYDGQADCETALTPCVGTPTTTSTTTTTAACAGNCVSECFDNGGGSYGWYHVRSNCVGGCADCGCWDLPSSPCDGGSVGNQESVPCRCQSLTTSTSSTSTSSTSSTSTSSTSSTSTSSTSSSTTTSTTTTTCGCSGGCTWYCNGFAWVEQGVPCTTANGCITCECNNYPATVCDGGNLGATAAGTCVQTTTTTTTS